MCDIVGIYTDAGDLTAKYTYDSWGNVTSITDGNGNAITSATHIGNLNPFRYRGYYMDTETGMYYLMSRYYDPVTHRFINADGYFQTGLGILDGNMNAYCGNNPINCYDPTGTITLREAQRLLISDQPVSFNMEDIILAYKMGYGPNDEEPFLSAKASMSIAFGSIRTTSYKGWNWRIDAADTSTNTRRHIHIKGYGKEYIQNIDGSPHDKSRSSGSPPNTLKKYLKKEGIWDWDANQKKYENSQVNLNNEFKSMQTLYGCNGTSVMVMPIDPSIPVVSLPSIYYFFSFGYSPCILY